MARSSECDYSHIHRYLLTGLNGYVLHFAVFRHDLPAFVQGKDAQDLATGEKAEVLPHIKETRTDQAYDDHQGEAVAGSFSLLLALAISSFGGTR